MKFHNACIQNIEVSACIFFQSHELLISLKMNGNKIGNKGGMYFAGALQVNTTLEALDLGDTDLVTTSLSVACTF